MQIQRGRIVSPAGAAVESSKGDGAYASQKVRKDRQHYEGGGQAWLVEGEGVCQERSNYDRPPKPLRHGSAILYNPAADVLPEQFEMLIRHETPETDTGLG